MFRIFDRLLEVKRESPSTLGATQTNLGWNLIEVGVMLVMCLRHILNPSVQSYYDSMHIAYVGGLFNVHVGLFQTFTLMQVPKTTLGHNVAVS